MAKVKKNKALDFAAHLKSVEKNYEMVQVLDETGKVVNEDLVPDLKDEELVELFEKQVNLQVIMHLIKMIFYSRDIGIFLN